MVIANEKGHPRGCPFSHAGYDLPDDTDELRCSVWPGTGLGAGTGEGEVERGLAGVVGGMRLAADMIIFDTPYTEIEEPADPRATPDEAGPLFFAPPPRRLQRTPFSAIY